MLAVACNTWSITGRRRPTAPQREGVFVPSSDLTSTERRIRDAMVTGRLVDLRDDPRSDEAAHWTHSRQVRAEVLSALLLSAGPEAVALRVRGARITGHLNLGGRRLPVPIEFRDCVFTGKVYLAKSRVPELSLRGSYFPYGISGRGLRVAGALNLTDCHFDDRLYLKRLGAEIVFMDGVIAHGSGEFAVQLRGADITQELYCRNGFMTRGCTTVYGAKIGGQLIMDGARLENPGGTALVAPNLELGQDLRLRRATVIGRVDLLKAKIGGDLALNGSTLANPGGEALCADMVHVGQNVFLHDGFNAQGEVSLFLSRVEGRMEVDKARLHNPRGLALDVSRAEIGQSVILSGLSAHGELKLYAANIGGNLSLDGVTVTNPGAIALDGVQCRVGQSMWLDRGARLDGIADLSNMRITNRLRLADADIASLRAGELSVAILDDDPRCWPDDSHIGGMRYHRLPEDGRGSPRARIGWLKRLLSRYSPQPYAQLVAAYRGSGSVTAARMVVMAKEDARRRDHRNWLRRAVSTVWSAVLRWTIGYGYAPWRAVGWAIALFAAAWLVFAGAPDSAFDSRSPLTDHFEPALYALDTVLPVVQISSGTQWIVHGGYAWWEAFFASTGWFLSIVVVAGVGGVFKRD
jgi:hypothetical protein